MYVFRPWRAGDDFLRSVFDWPASRFTLPEMQGDHALSLGAVPVHEVIEREDQLELVFEAPGASPQDVMLTYEAGQLQVRIRRPVSRSEGHRIQAERPAGELYRAVTVGSNYDADSIEAKLDNGLLVVRLTKRPDAQPKKIPVASSAPAQLSELERRRS